MFEVRLTAPLVATPVGGSRTVRLCTGSVVEVHLSPSGRVAGLVLGGRRFTAPADELRRVAVFPAPPVPAPVVAVDPGWEPRYQVRPGSSAGPRFRAPAPRRSGPSPAEIAACQRRSPLWEWRSRS